MSGLRDSINQFISFFHAQTEAISSIQISKPIDYSIFKRILYIGIIDALSKTVYPRKGNRERFVSFIKGFSKWKSCEKISLPHLVRLLEEIPDPEFSVLRKFAFSRFDTWVPGEIVELDRDPDHDEVYKLWPKAKEYTTPILNVQLSFLQHANLLYTYRNFLIHEMRKPGYGMDLGDRRLPFYYSMSHLREGQKDTWELVYPTAFFESVCKCILEKLEKFYMANRIDPYTLFVFGTYWIEELNQ
jgi:hypothetical protein